MKKRASPDTVHTASDLAKMPKLKNYIGVLKFSTQCLERQDTTTLRPIVFKMAAPIIINVMYYKKNNEERFILTGRGVLYPYNLFST